MDMALDHKTSREKELESTLSGIKQFCEDSDDFGYNICTKDIISFSTIFA